MSKLLDILIIMFLPKLTISISEYKMASKDAPGVIKKLDEVGD